MNVEVVLIKGERENVGGVGGVITVMGWEGVKGW
jgi:hypothetical protein